MHVCTVALVQEITPMAWTGPGERKKGPLPIKTGDYLELQVYDDEELDQGTILVGVIDVLGKYKSGTVVSAMYLGASDAYYHWWMLEGEGSPDPDGGAYHLCGVKTKDCPPTDKYGEMIHSDKVRIVPKANIEQAKIPWTKDRIVRAGVDSRMARYEGLMVAQSKPPVSGGPGQGTVTWAGQPGASEEASEEEVESSSEEEEESSSGEATMKQKIQELKDELERAERDMTGTKAKKKAKKKRKKVTKEKEAKAVKAKTKEPKKEEKKKPKGEKEIKNQDAKRKRKKDEEKVKRKKKKKRKKEDEEDLPKKKRKREEETEEEEEESSDEKPLFTAAKKSAERATPKKGDRGPFGGGSAVAYGTEESEEESDQDFRKAPSTSAKGGQLKLLNYAHQFPGRLASRLLIRMSQVTARGVGGAEPEMSHLTPVVALHYVLTILLPSLGAKAGMRTGRELKTLASILDHLASQEPAKAADVTAQRIKALERATAEGHWGAAQFLELLPSEGTMLLDWAEENYVAKGYLQDMKLKGYDKPYRGNQDKGKGKGKEPKGKGKGKKSDGDDKKTDKWTLPRTPGEEPLSETAKIPRSWKRGLKSCAGTWAKRGSPWRS